MDDVARIDFEAYSELEVTKVGAAVYAEHPSTDIICLRWAIGDDEPTEWLPGQPFPFDLAAWIADGKPVEAHGSLFEYYIWLRVGIARYDFPCIPKDQWRCSMAQAARRGLPLKLETLAKVAAVGEQKDTEGARAMRLLASPDRKTGARLEPAEHPDLLATTSAYCAQDVRTERAVSRFCGPLTAPELRLWQLDQTMQHRGLRIDQELCRAALAVVKAERARLLPEVPRVTGGAVQTPDQRDKVLAWLRDTQGVSLPDLTKDTVAATLPGLEPGGPAHRLLELRQALGSKSHAKYKKALECVAADGRVHGATQYHAAHTGRNGGRLFQPQNLRRPIYVKDMHLLASAIKMRDPEFLSAVTGCDAFEALADAARGMIISEEDRVLISGDFSSIEAVVTAALANEEWKVQLFRDGGDPYCAFASRAVGRTVLPKDHPGATSQDKADRQNVGKPGELAFGFGGGYLAWLNFDSSGRFNRAEIEGFRDTWRENHSRVRAMWGGLDYCAINAVLHPGKVYSWCAPGLDPAIHSIRYVVRGDYLLCQLPSERKLHYFQPTVRDTQMPWTNDNGDPVFRPQVWYWTMREGRWQHVKGYGGHWTENIVQATARDLLVPALFAVEALGYFPVLTIYDEALGEPLRSRQPCVEEYADAMVKAALAQQWAAEWPIRADAWIDTRFKKD